LLSVIVPVYNAERYLRQCLDSIVGQTYPNIEIILVNDGSTDGSGRICDEYAAKDSRIRVIHQRNKGLIGARKTAIAAARGEYVGWVDADDWIEPQMYETLMALAHRTGAAVVDSGVIDTYTFGNQCSESRRHALYPEGYYAGKKFAREIIPTMIYAGYFFQHGIFPYHWTKIYKRKLLSEWLLRLDEKSSLAEDAACSYPCIVTSESLYVTHQCFYHYRVVPQSHKRTPVPGAERIIRDRVRDWKYAFGLSKYKDELNRQLLYYAMYLLIWKAPYVFDRDGQKCLMPYGGVEKGAKIVLYGAGAVGHHLYHYIKESQCCEIVGWADRNYAAHADSGVIEPTAITRLDFNYLVISILNRKAYLSARNDLLALGIDARKIRWIDEKYIDNPMLLLEQSMVKEVFFDEP